MLNICGNSFKLVFLKNLPILVIHSSGFSNIWVGVSFGVSIRIVLNLYILNNFLFLPTLFCLKKIGPLLSILINIINIRNIGDNTISPINANNISINFLNILYII